MAYKKWTLRSADKEKASLISEKFNIDPFVAYLMVSRGIESDIDVSMFLSKNCFMTSPLDFVDMDEAVFAIGEAIDIGEKICVYGDYDCDGVTSTALLFDFLQKEGADVIYYIPSRENEGYGLNTEAVDDLYCRGVSLIVTVDNGIASFDEAEYIYKKNMRLVITDHHQLVGEKLPRAEAVVNPHRSENNLKFRDYCGVGVAFKLVCAMYDGDLEDIKDRYIDLVMLGTIADIVPLTDENRNFVRLGLEHIASDPLPALKSFAFHSGSEKFSSADIAFKLCPRINAMGRMGDASRAVEFLLSEGAESAEILYSELCRENENRQTTEKKILDDVNGAIEKNPSLVSDRVIVISGKNYHHGVVGIVAAHICEKYGKPTFILSVGDDGTAVGSARSVEGFDVFEALKACSSQLIKFGGHPKAAGVTLSSDKTDDFRRSINDYAIKKYPVMPPAQLLIDCRISPSYLTLELVASLEKLEPFGEKNPTPVFSVCKLTLRGITPLKEGRHIRLDLEKKGKRVKAVYFGVSPDEFPYQVGDLIDVAVKVSENLFNSRQYLSVRVVDAKLSSADDDKYFEEKSKYDLYRSTGKGDASLLPDRSDCAVVYKYLRQRGGFDYSPDDLYFRLQNRLTYGKLMFALKAFIQCGLINYDKKITVLEPAKKVQLEQCEVLKTLKGRIGSE